MIDTMSISANIRLPEQVLQKQPEPFIWNGIILSPRFNNKGSITNYTGKLEDMRLSLSLSGMYISNSWHKYFTHGNNFTDYTSPEVAETFYILNNTLKGSLLNTVVKKIAYGVVIDAEPDFDKWFMLRTKQPFPMVNKGNIYGAKIQMNDYSIKAYDKTYEVKKHNGITIPQSYRIEKEVAYMKHLYNRKHPIPIFQAYDLTRPDIMRQLGCDFIQTYQQIEKSNDMNLYGLTIHELNVVASMQNKNVREHLRQENNRTYKKYRTEFKKMKNELQFDSGIEQKIIEKVGFLTAS